MTTDLQKAADATAKLLTELQDSTDRLKIHNSELQNQVNNLEESYVRLQEAAGRALAERDYYMRECAELEGKFTSFCSIATEAINTHRMAPFRPNGAAPKDSQGDTLGPNDIETGVSKAIAEANGLDDAIPAFLTKPTHPDGKPEWTDKQLQGPHKPEGSLKLRRKV